MTTQRNHSNNKARGSIGEAQAQVEDPLLFGYAKWIGDPDSLEPMPGCRGKVWVMRCPLRVHPGKVRTFLLDSIANHWWCTACAIHGDVADLAARLNRFDPTEAEQVLDIFIDNYLESVMRSAE
jgi:hypothetical protein